MFAREKSPTLFSHFSTIGAISFLLCALVLTVAPASGQQNSVVLINTEAGSGYGVAWRSPGKIVTALHLVAGRSKIFVKWENKESRARIKKVYKQADLALLELEKPLNIPALEIYNAGAPMRVDLNYWEAAQNAAAMSDKTTQLEKRAELSKLSTRLEKDPTGFAKALCSDYPALNTKVFQFEHPDIKKAHSGSPLTFGNLIVGMVDGGGGKPLGGKTCVWAIPATEFENLEKLGVAPSNLPQCSSTNLYSGLRADNPHLDPALAELAKAIAASEENPFGFDDDSGDRLAFELEYRAPFRDIYDTMFDEDQGYVEELVQENEAAFEEGQQVTVDDLFSQSINIFQEAETGATIAVPAASELRIKKEDGHTLVEASSPYEGITMIIFVENTNSIEASKSAMNWFKSYIMSDRQDWILEEGEKDEIEDWLEDTDEPYYSELMERVAYDEEDNLVAELYASLTIDKTNFLGVVVKVNDWATLDDDQEERIFFYLMEACTILTDFAYY